MNQYRTSTDRRWVGTLLLGLALAAAVSGVSRASDHAAAAPGAAPVDVGAAAPSARHDAAHVSTSAAPDAGNSDEGLTSTEALWADLMEGNRRFVEGRPFPREYLLTRSRLAGGQQPPVMVLGCADSRLSPELIFDKNLGELFVVRTAGNIADAIALGSLEYAAEHLHSRLLVVLGHEKCGAVAAAASGVTMPSPNLQAIVEQITPALSGSVAYHQHKPIGLAEVKANARCSAEYVLRNSPVLAHLMKEGKIQVVAAIYELASGEVTRLEGDFTAGDESGHE